ncbi:MAG: hypothetical protein IK093_00575, partial [Ruminiclostridium sp.]|nr:hypothetical protein [Ruminiclostridium sp.]
MDIGYIVSVALNILSFILTVIGTYVMIKGIDADEHLAADGWGSIKYFTVQSNLLYGIYAGVFAVCELIYGSADDIPQFLYVLKYIFTVGVTLTMLTVICYLAPVVEKSYPKLFKGANLYFHLIVPLLGIISFCFFEKEAEISVPFVFLGLIPFGLYGIYYSINALSHAENGKVDLESPAHVDKELLVQHMNDLAEGKEITLPIFQFSDQSRHWGPKLRREKNDIFIYEGTHALNPDVTGLASAWSHKMYVSVRTRLQYDVKGGDDKLLDPAYI